MHNQISIELVPFPPSVPMARALADRVPGLATRTREQLRLLISELVTLAVLHARSTDSERITLRVCWFSDRIEVSVRDPGRLIASSDSAQLSHGIDMVQRLTGDNAAARHRLRRPPLPSGAAKIAAPQALSPLPPGA